MNVMYFASSLNIHRQLTTKYTESKKKQKTVQFFASRVTRYRLHLHFFIYLRLACLDPVD